MTAAPPIKLLLDTAYCLHLIHTRPRHLQAVFEPFAAGEIAVSSITVAALRARAEQSREPTRNQHALNQFLLPLAVVDFDTAAASMLDKVSAHQTPQTASADMHYLLLAAHALSLGAVLITAEPSLYAAVADLQVNSGAGAALVAPVDETANSGAPLADPIGVILAFGSHDVTLDLFGDHLHTAYPSHTLLSAHVGSLGGLLALQQRQAHLAGAHLLDEENGEYNAPFIHRLLTPHGINVALFGFVTRVQGLIVAEDNPKRITGLGDLRRDDVTFVNRQRGAGTRVLLDYHLRQAMIAALNIRGYDREESSHLAVATAIASGAADCGLGIQAIAQAHNLDFIPLFDERYDLVIPVEHVESELLIPFMTLLRRPPRSFLQRVAALGGYGTGDMGKLLAEI